jgi:hypothetical protein
MLQELTQLFQSLTNQNWFATAALTIMLGIQIGKSTPLGGRVYSLVPDGYRFLVPTVLAMLTAFVHGFQVHETFQASVWDAIKIALGAMGGAAALKESPLPWGGGAGGKPLPALSRAPTAPALVPALRNATDDEQTPVDHRTQPSDRPESD